MSNQLEELPCGHDGRFEVTWKEIRSYAVVFVSFCIACNYESVSKKINEGPEVNR
jgi:hypothetical protein